jgi:hypothetical protein
VGVFNFTFGRERGREGERERGREGERERGRDGTGRSSANRVLKKRESIEELKVQRLNFLIIFLGGSRIKHEGSGGEGGGGG